MKLNNLNIRIIIVTLTATISMITLTACGDKEYSETATDYIISQYTNISGNGELFVDSLGRLNFCDFSSMESVLLCPNPNCTHRDSQSCSSYGMDNHPVIFGNSIYFFEVETIQTDNEFSDNTMIYKANTDGTNRSTVYTISNLSLHAYSRMLIHNNIAFFVAEENEYDQYGNTTGFSTAYLCSFDLLSNEFNKLTEIYNGYSGGSWVYGIYNNEIYLTCGASKTQIDFTDLDALEKIENTLMRYNLSDSSFKKSDSPVPIFIGSGYYVYSDDNSTTILNETMDAAIQSQTIISDAVIINEKLFSSTAGICIDINLNEIYALNNADKEIVGFVNGIYILRQFGETGYEYSAITDNKLIRCEVK